MFCPKCKSESVYVLETMPADDGKIFRRRRCSDCGTSFRTVEITAEDYCGGAPEFNREYSTAYEKKHPRRKKNV